MQLFKTSELDRKKKELKTGGMETLEEGEQEAAGTGVDDEIKKIMEEYRNGNRSEACTKMINRLDGLIHYIIKHRFYTYATNGYEDDMYQQACLGIMQAMERYDTDTASPTTYFKFYILGSIKECVNRNHYNTSQYYADIMRRIRQFRSDRLSRGLETTENDVVQILGMKLQKISTATLRECYLRVIANDQEEYYQEEDTEDKQEQLGTFDTPEKLFLEKEKKKAIYHALDTLSEQERYVIVCVNGLYQTYKDEISNIVHHYTEYSRFEQFVANGYKPAQKLNLFGFSRAEVLMLRGLSKADAVYAAEVFETGEDSDSERFLKISDYLTGVKSELAFRDNCSETGFTKVLKEFGHTMTEMEEIINGKAVSHVRLADVKDISTRTLLMAKGLTQQDLDKVIHGEPLSNIKTAPLLNLKQGDIKNIEIRAIKKIGKILRTTIDEQPRKTMMSHILNDTDMKIQPDIMEYVEAFQEDIMNAEEFELNY